MIKVNNKNTTKTPLTSFWSFWACFEFGRTNNEKKKNPQHKRHGIFFVGTLQHPNSLAVNHNSFLLDDHKFTGEYFNLLGERNLQPSHLCITYFFPQNSCVHSVLVINIFIFEQKNLFVSLASKINSFLRLTNSFHLSKLIAGMFI